ncbi:hypothetical protein [Streptomyces sp. IBSNAI001]|uniref:hypothetical protein n=1 Tax=Streptomyces sp. IBSNAI001 TaxID=3457499 RepID=UPI003FD01B60
MSERTVTPGGPWVSAGAFEVRTVLEDPLGTIRVRPTATAPRQFRDCDGDIWEPASAGYLKCVAAPDGAPHESGRTETRAWVEENYGPLTEIRPDVDVRLLLAGVLDDMAVEALDAFMGTDVVAEERVYSKMAQIFDRKARALREEAAG